MAILTGIYVVAAVVLLFGAAVFVHEWGHYFMARRRGLKATTVDLRNSGDTAGPRDQVVGYGAYLFE